MSSSKELIAEIEKDYGIKLNHKGYQGPLGIKKLKKVCEQIEATALPTNNDEKQSIIDELAEKHGKDLNLADYEGSKGYDKLLGYYEAVTDHAAAAREDAQAATAPHGPKNKKAKGSVTPPA